MQTFTTGTATVPITDGSDHIKWLNEHLKKRERAPAPDTRRRGPGRPSAEPIVRNVRDEPALITVSLRGARGTRRDMLIDRREWADVSARFGTRFVIESRGDAQGRCVFPEGVDGAAPLAHYLTEARAGEVVRHHNGDVTDLRLVNLVVTVRD